MQKVKLLARIVMGMKPRFVIMNQNPRDNPWNDDTHPLLPRKIQVGTLCQKCYADIVLGYEWMNSRTLSGKMRDSQQCKLQHHARREVKSTIRSRRRGHLSECVDLLHDSA
jgi:hypothetical protein